MAIFTRHQLQIARGRQVRIDALGRKGETNGRAGNLLSLGLHPHLCSELDSDRGHDRSICDRPHRAVPPLDGGRRWQP